MVLDIPPVLVGALVRLAPLLAVVTRAARLLAWADDWYASWLVLAAWSFLCLAAPALFRYAVPLLVALLVFLLNAHPPPSPLLTDTVVRAAIADLATLATGLPSLPPVSLPPRALFRAAAILTVPWLVLTHLLRTRLLLALAGSLFIVHRAPWAYLLASVLWRSAFVRAALHAAHAFLTGQPLPKPLPSTTTTTSDPSSSHTLRFLLSVHENQRWWVGLDWTAALIPSERPAWSSPALLPVSPPAAFVLPDPTTIHLPAPDAKSTIKRTATWKWVDPEWRLLVRTPGSSLSRICRPLPADDSSSSASSPSLASSASRLFKPASLKFKAPSSQSSVPQDDNDNDNGNGNGNDDSYQPLTDPDGWIYSDNKWENPSHSNSLGKYTRYRRWSRIAIVSEHVQLVPSAATDHQPHSTDTRSTSTTPLSVTSVILQPDTCSTTSAIPQPDSPLRQRLRDALSNASISTSS